MLLALVVVMVVMAPTVASIRVFIRREAASAVNTRNKTHQMREHGES